MIGHHLCNDATQHNPVEKVPAFSKGRWALLASPTSQGKEDGVFYEIRHSQGTLIAQQFELTPGLRS